MGRHNNSKMPFPIRPPRSLPFPRQNPLDKQPFFCDVPFSAVAVYLILFHAQECCYCLIQTLFWPFFIGKMSFLGKACKSCGCSSVFSISKVTSRLENILFPLKRVRDSKCKHSDRSRSPENCQICQL